MYNLLNIPKYGKNRKFDVCEAKSPKDYRDAAIEAEHYVRTFQTETGDGIYWNEVETSGNLTFYRGSAGILYMYIKLYEATASEEYLNIIEKAVRYLRLHWHDMITYASEHGELVDGMAKGLYMGIGGIGMALAEAFRLNGSQEALDAVKAIVSFYKKDAVYCEDGAYWSDNSPVYFDSGAVLFLVDAYEILGDDEILTLIEEAANHLIANGIRHEDGGLEINHLIFTPKKDEPNFEFGTAGVGYLFGKIYELNGKEKYLEAAKAAAKYIVSIAVKQDSGYLIPYKLTMDEDLFYLGACHGPAGTTKLFYQLYKITGDRYYYNQVIQLTKGLESLGAPLRQSPGYWNTLCVCCGPAGLVSMYIGLYLTDKNEHWRQMARQAGNILLAYKNVDRGAAKWFLAFDRTEPDNITSPAGYLIGTAGIGVMLLQLYLEETDNFKWRRLVDDPFPDKVQCSEGSIN